MRRLLLSIAIAALLPACLSEGEVPADEGFYGPGARATYVLEFGEVQVGAQATRSALIRAGSQPVLLSPPEVEPPFYTEMEEVERLDPGEEREIHFTYRPATVGKHVQETAIRTNGSQGAYRLQGVARAAGPGCETEVVSDSSAAPAPRVDVLLLVDDHLSMGGIRDRLVAEAQALPALMDEAGIDWRLALTTSGLGQGCPGGELLGEKPILSPMDQDAHRLLAAALREATCGGNSHGLAAVVEAERAAKRTFDREDAGLVLLVVSTRDDRSPEPVSTYVGLLEAERGQEGEAQIRARALLGEGCEGCAAAERYMEAVELLGGSLRSFTDEAWFADLFSAADTFGMPLIYPLERLPVDQDEDGSISSGAELEVRIDGRSVAPLDREGAQVWRYDPETNAVLFSRDHAPVQGESVDLVYLSRCVGA